MTSENYPPAANPLRAAARAAIADIDGAFLRVDRGAALYITDAPRRTADTARLLRALSAAGFTAAEENELLHFAPDATWIPRVYRWARALVEPDEQLRLLARLENRPVVPEDFALFIDALKRLERNGGAENDNILERRVRQNAAAALRTGKSGGALACAYAVLLLSRKRIRSCKV